MITQGLSQHEINLISKILDEYRIQYQIAASGGAEGAIIRGGRGDASFYSIEIPQSEYDKLPPAAKGNLENLGIYPEMEAPVFVEEKPKQEKPAEEVASLKKKHKRIEYAIIAGLLIGLLFFVKKVVSEQ